jgi:hypothetical protein
VDLRLLVGNEKQHNYFLISKTYNYMNNIPKRAVIFKQDIMLITGRGERYCERLMKQMRKSLNKQGLALISIDEFVQFTGLSKELVESYIV